jgi:uncharacterized delta-60 repeat protein
MRDPHQHKCIGKVVTYLLAITFLFVSSASATRAAPGDLDPTFGIGGKLTDWSGWATSVVIQPDGKLVVAGDVDEYGLARYNSDGSIDKTFGNGTGKIVAAAHGAWRPGISVTKQPDGKIVVAGLAYYGDMWDIGLDILRYNSDGSPDTTFGDSGRVNLNASSSRYYDATWVHIQPDGKIIAGAGVRIYRLDPNGLLDTTFGGGDGIANLPMSAYASAIQPNGKIVIASPRGADSPGLYDLGVARCNPDGTLDTTFGSGGLVTTPMNTQKETVARSVAIQTDGKIVAGGYRLVRYNENGSLDTGFGNGGIVTMPIGPFRQVVIQSDGKLVTAGNSNNDFAIARYNANGSLDTTFGSGDGISTVDFDNSDDSANAMVLDHQGRAVIVGASTSGSNSRFALARLLLEPRQIPFDFDGDGRSDVSVFRPSDSVWYLSRSTEGFFATQFGLPTDKVVPADYDGDGRTDIAVFRDGVWWLRNSSGGAVQAIQFGAAGDIPVPADYTGDGRDELAVFRNGQWWTFDLTNNQSSFLNFGLTTDKPVPADYDGDGRVDQAVYRNGEWHLNGSTQGYTVINFGLASDRPVVGDYDGDGKSDLAVYRDGTWYVQQSTAGFRVFQWGLATDIPAPADYDGDGKTDPAVYRDGAWYLFRSTGEISIQQFGLANDKPVPSAFVP